MFERDLAKLRTDGYRRDVHWLAVLAAALTWPLLLSGGQVTTYRVGMAVPDWPTTFGINMFVFKFFNSSWGVFIEHRHRLLGALVGLDLIVLAAWFTFRERRLPVKLMGQAALLGVIVQGVLGGARVRLNSTLLAAIHGCTGQTLFALLVAIAVVTSRNWIESPKRTNQDRLRLGFWSIGLVVLLGFQVVAGAILRHFGSGLALHVSLGIAAAVASIALAVAIERRRPDLTRLIPPIRCIEISLFVQLTLGILAWWLLSPFNGIARPVSTIQALIRTGHQGNGALLLASSVALALWARRSLVPMRSSLPALFSASVRTPERELEAAL